MLAYVFWHWPAGEPAGYVEALGAFHRALAAAPPPGYRGSRVLAVDGAPWLPVEQAFEDWYFVEDFAALGALNEAAVSGTRLAPHDAAARRAAGGTAGLYRLRSGTLGAAARASWFGKPSGMSYAELFARIPDAGELWQRQMVLGPAPEMCLVGAAPPAGIDARTLAVRTVVG
jgi:hypothetical protein